MLDLLTNALGGGALGVLLRIGNGFFETWRADKESKLKIEEAKAMAAIAADKAAWDAFTASVATVSSVAALTVRLDLTSVPTVAPLNARPS